MGRVGQRAPSVAEKRMQRTPDTAAPPCASSAHAATVKERVASLFLGRRHGLEKVVVTPKLT